MRPLLSQLSSALPRIAATLLLALVAASAHARGGPHGDLFAGYSRLESNGGYNGWEADGHLKLAPFLGAEANISGYNNVQPDGSNGYLYLFGPRATVSAGGVHLFARFLVGDQHFGGGFSGNNFAYGGGGGVEVPVFIHLAWRFSGDSIRANSINSGRFSTGPVLRF